MDPTSLIVIVAMTASVAVFSILVLRFSRGIRSDPVRKQFYHDPEVKRMYRLTALAMIPILIFLLLRVLGII